MKRHRVWRVSVRCSDTMDSGCPFRPIWNDNPPNRGGCVFQASARPLNTPKPSFDIARREEGRCGVEKSPSWLTWHWSKGREGGGALINASRSPLFNPAWLAVDEASNPSFSITLRSMDRRGGRVVIIGRERESCVDTFRCGIERCYLLFVFRMLQLNYNCIVEMISWYFYIFPRNLYYKHFDSSCNYVWCIICRLLHKFNFSKLDTSTRNSLWKLFAPLYNSVET